MGVHINDAYRILSPNTPAQSITGADGIITFVQPTPDIRRSDLHITQYRPLEIVKRLVVIVGDLVLEMAKNTVVKTLAVVKNLTNAVIEELNKPISIPIISPLYKSIAGDELSIMSCVLLQQLPRLLLQSYHWKQSIP